MGYFMTKKSFVAEVTFKDLLTYKIFSKQILSCNFKMELCLKRGLACGFLGWKLIVLTAFFCKITIC